MAKATFTKGEIEAAKASGQPLVLLAVQASHVPGFPHRDYQVSPTLDAATTARLIRAVEGVVSSSSGGHPAGACPGAADV